MAKEKDDLISRVKRFMSENSDSFTLNNDDFKVSKRVSSGLGWGEDDRKIWGEDRAEVTVNILRPYVNKLVAQYDSNPFGLGVKNLGFVQRDLTRIRYIMDYVINSSDFNVVVSDSIRETVNDGVSYVLVYHEENVNGEYDIKIKKLNNGSVFFPENCKEANGSDAKMVVHADVIDKEEAKANYEFDDREFKQADILKGYNVIENPQKECGLITVYEKVEDGVKVSKIIHSKIVDETILPIKNIPIVRFYGEKVTLKNKVNWRGAYYFVADLIRSINFYASLQQERVACSPTTGYLIAAESLTGKDNQWTKINGAPRAYLTYKAYDSGDSSKPLPTPQKIQQEAQIADVSSSIAGFQSIISSILGDTGSNEPAVNETAESVLLRKSNNEASISLYIRNAKDSSVAVGRVILQMISMVFVKQRNIDGVIINPVEDISALDVYVENGPIAASQKEKNIRQLVAFGTMVSGNPEAMKIAPVIIDNLDIDPKAKQFLMSTYSNSQAAIPQEVQVQMTAKDTQIAQMSAQMDEMNKTISQLQTALFEMQNDSKTKLLIAALDNKTKFEIEAMKLDASQRELAMKLIADADKNFNKLKGELEKEQIKLEAPIKPIWNTSKFV